MRVNMLTYYQKYQQIDQRELEQESPESRDSRFHNTLSSQFDELLAFYLTEIK
jgi:primosomal protein N''